MYCQARCPPCLSSLADFCRPLSWLYSSGSIEHTECRSFFLSRLRSLSLFLDNKEVIMGPICRDGRGIYDSVFHKKCFDSNFQPIDTYLSEADLAYELLLLVGAPPLPSLSLSLSRSLSLSLSRSRSRSLSLSLWPGLGGAGAGGGSSLKLTLFSKLTDFLPADIVDIMYNM